MAANTYTTYGIADGPSEAGLVRVVMEGEALAQPSEEEVSETIPAERFEGGRASLAAEPYPGTTQVWRGSEAEANLLDESEWTVEGATLTIWELASDPVALVEWETSLSRELTDADFAGGRAALMGEPSSVTLTEDDEPVPFELDGSVLVVEGMGTGDGLVRATYSHAVELTLPAGMTTLPDAPEEVTVMGRTLGEDPSEEPAPYVLDGSVLTIAEGWDEYVVTYSAQAEEAWSLSEQVREEPAPDSEEGEEGTLEPTSELVGHVLQWEPEGLSITLDGEPTTDWTLDGRTVTVGASGTGRTLNLECAMPQSVEVPSSALRASYELPTLPSGEVSVTVGGEALGCTVEDRTITVPSLWPEVAQYAVRYSAMVPQGSVEMPCAPVVQDGESVVVTVVNGSPMVTAVMGSGDAMQGQVTDATTLAVDASTAADAAQAAAEAAQEIAEATGQHVWEDTDGLHVTQAEKDTFLTTPTGRNILMNALGILIRDALQYRTVVHDEGLTVYDGQGNAASNVVANILRDLITLGYAGETHAEVDYHSLQLIDKEGNTYFHVSDLRDQTGAATITETFTAEAGQTLFEVALYSSALISATVNGVADEQATAVGELVTLWNPCAAGDVVVITYETQSVYAKAYSLGVRAAGGIVGGMSTAEGNNTTASAFSTHAEGGETTASGNYAHAEGYQTTASGVYSHAEGYMTTASNEYGAHAEGYITEAAGTYSHAEGNQTHAEGVGSHAEGESTQATGQYSHAEGHNTFASANYAHAEGSYSHATASEAHAEGCWTHASNSYAHAEGHSTHATGDTSHAEGINSRAESRATHAQNLGTYAIGEAQTAIGKYNATDNTKALIIGNGTDDSARSNALTVDWSGNVDAAGDVTAANLGGPYYSGDMNDLTTSGIYYVDASSTNVPAANYAGQCVVANSGDGFIVQLFTVTSANPSQYARRMNTGGWGSWALIGAPADETTFTPSNATATSILLHRARPNCTIYVDNLRVSSALASGSTLALGTLPSNYRPHHYMVVPLVCNNNNNLATGSWLAIGTGGGVTLYNRTGASIGTTNGLYGTTTYSI